MYGTIQSIIGFFLLTVMLASCGKLDQFERNVSIPNYRWAQSFEPEIEFTISDTTSLYQIFIVLRHTHAYSYKNLWIQLSSKQPGDSSFRSEKLELTLQEPDGQWKGTGLSDIWEVRYPLFSNIRFLRTGTYTVKLKQIMRDDPLEHVMNAGIRLEKMQR